MICSAGKRSRFFGDTDVSIFSRGHATLLLTVSVGTFNFVVQILVAIPPTMLKAVNRFHIPSFLRAFMISVTVSSLRNFGCSMFIPQTGCKQMQTKCNGVYQPVCDTNGKSHINLCNFEVKNCLQGGILKLGTCGELRN